jgi:hypothetical protein
MQFASVFLLALLIAACAHAPTPFLSQNPSDPHAAVPPVRHTSALRTYQSQRPVDPVPWREQNERVAPRPKQ